MSSTKSIQPTGRKRRAAPERHDVSRAAGTPGIVGGEPLKGATT